MVGWGQRPRVFRTEGEKWTGGQIKLYIEELRHLYSLQNISMGIKLRAMEWVDLCCTLERPEIHTNFSSEG